MPSWNNYVGIFTWKKITEKLSSKGSPCCIWNRCLPQAYRSTSVWHVTTKHRSFREIGHSSSTVGSCHFTQPSTAYRVQNRRRDSLKTFSQHLMIHHWLGNCKERFIKSPWLSFSHLPIRNNTSWHDEGNLQKKAALTPNLNPATYNGDSSLHQVAPCPYLKQRTEKPVENCAYTLWLRSVNSKWREIHNCTDHPTKLFPERRKTRARIGITSFPTECYPIGVETWGSSLSSVVSDTVHVVTGCEKWFLLNAY